MFETTAPPARIVHETPRDKREKRKKLKQEEHQKQLEEEIKQWDPHKPSSAVAAVTTKDAYKTLFVARLSYDTTAETLRREFEAYGPVSRIRVVHKRGKDDILTGSDEGDAPRGYAFVEFEREEDMRARGVPSCRGAFTPSTRLVSIRRGRGWLPRCSAQAPGLQARRRAEGRRSKAFS